MGEPMVADRDARRRIETDLDCNLFVEAGAGAGKTESLVRRIVALFAGGRCEPRQLAAITFTRKAAAELRQRLQVRLETAATGESDPVWAERLREASLHLGEAFLGTIHSFCARLLREHPIEAGLDPEFTELEEEEAAGLQEAAWHDYLTLLQVQRPELPAVLEDLDVTPDDLHAVYARLALYPEVRVVRGDGPRPDFEAEVGDLQGLLRAVRAHFPARRPEKGWDGLQTAVVHCERLLRLGGPGRERRLIRAFEHLGRSLRVTQNRWPSHEDAHEAFGLYTDYRATHLDALLLAWREYRHARLVDLVLPALDFAAARRRAEARLDYEDLLLGAARLLRCSPSARARLGDRFTHVLVDEFQDTDPIQAEVMFLLTGEPRDESDWRRLRPRPGSLFVVGDPKQSIYRFRRADIAIYQEVKARILATGGDVVELQANFRSVPAVAGWASAAFGEILPRAATPYQAAFAPLLPVRAGGAGLRGVFTITLGKVAGNRPEAIAELDAARIADWIAWACAGHLAFERSREEVAAGLTAGAQPGDFLILVPYRGRIPVYAAALEARGLPLQVSGGASYTAAAQVRPFLQLLSATADPEDPVRLLACLRGPYFGLSDDELYRFRAAGGSFSLLRPRSIPDDPVAAACARLYQYWRLTRTLPPAAAAARILGDLGALPLAAAGPLGASESGALLGVMEMLRAAAAEPGNAFGQVVARIAAALAVTDRDAPSLIPASGRTVRLMNLHKAKGLEAPVVFLADPSRRRDHPPTGHVSRQGPEPLGHFLFERENHGGLLGQPPGWAGAAAKEATFAAAESDRLLYVAATRARDLLVVSRYAPATDADPWAGLNQALQPMPELNAAPAAPGARPEIAIVGAEVAAAVAAGQSALLAASVPAYRQVAATDLAGSYPVPAGEGGDGASWGRAVHRLLAALARGLDATGVQPAALRALREEGREPGELQRLVYLVTAVWEGDLGARVRRSQRVLAEVPFGYRADDAADAGPMLIEGVVDLAFLEAAGWVLVDYKTDAAAEGHLERLAVHYAPQIRQYADFWRAGLRAPVAECLIFFTAAMKSIRVD